MNKIELLKEEWIRKQNKQQSEVLERMLIKEYGKKLIKKPEVNKKILINLFTKLYHTSVTTNAK